MLGLLVSVLVGGSVVSAVRAMQAVPAEGRQRFAASPTRADAPR